MTNLQEVPTDELLSFHDYPSVHSPTNLGNSPNEGAQLNLDIQDNDDNFKNSMIGGAGDAPLPDEDAGSHSQKSFWTFEYYQQFFDVDTKHVRDRIIASIIPVGNASLRNLHKKPDLYGPFWISVTLVFSLAISGNIANYLQHGNSTYHWRYDFHLVSYAATTICLYVTLIPLGLWAFIKWGSNKDNTLGMDGENGSSPSILDLICLYGYSLFIYIPVSILWSIQVSILQWALAFIASLLPCTVLLSTLKPAIRVNHHKIILILAVILCHLLLALGFMLYFFHVPKNVIAEHVSKIVVIGNTTVKTTVNETTTAI